ncbi:MAG TPA: glycosyltransferase [Candidatus Krumholzibacteria bacterium]|nr:glycosyltransferase [Candidatus Krumholzibacteria bacterium]
MTVSIVIVTYNSAKVIGACLDSLAADCASGLAEVIVVDNASADDSVQVVRERYPWAVLVAGRENLGYSKGVNLGIQRARGRFLLILNPDTVVRRGTLRRLIEFVEKTPDAGIVGPKLVFHDGTVQLSCRRFYTFRVLLLRRTPLGRILKNARAVREHLMQDFDHATTREVDWVLGAAMFVRREAVDNVGMMDERFFLYFEDVDWCYRMKQRGLKVYYLADAVIEHGYKRESAQAVLNRSFAAHLVSLFRYYEKWNAAFYFAKRYREVAKVSLFLLLDLVAFNAAFFSAYGLRVLLSDIFTNPIFSLRAYHQFLFFENLVFVFTFAFSGLYRIRRETRTVDELFTIARAIIIGAVLLMTSTYLSQIRTYSRMVVAFMVPAAILFDGLLRTGVRRVHRRLLSYQVDLKRACVVGPRERAREVEARLMNDDALGFDVVGVVDTAGESEGILTGTLGPVENIERIVERYRIHHVVVLPGAVGDVLLAELVALGRRRVIDVTVLTDYAGLVFHQAQVSSLQGRPVIFYPRDTRYLLERLTKRALDLVFGAGFAVVSLPGYVLYSLYAFARARKPFVVTSRLGAQGRPLVVPVAGGGRSDGPSDFVNLPLFWLVVIGRMSMVGPYPLRPEDAEHVGRVGRFRFDMRPGVTGYWRSGPARISRDDLLVQDTAYVQNWSLSNDAKILLETLASMLRGRQRVLEITTDDPREAPHAN